ncbi:pyridoxamine 5'-phosphate oxidase family protein [Rugamonas sp. A1-17]|nr:pyridoxamine 5'-phosphate oxidase family protein [Rugamonas sp. A1-17]
MPLYNQEQIHALAARIKDVPVGMFTTSGDQNVLTCRPLPTQQIDNEGNLWFFAADDADFTADLKQHPDVNISFSNPKENLYLSVSGHACMLKDRAKARELWHPTVRGWFPGGLDDPHLALIRVRVQTAEYWDAGAGKMKQLLQLARTAISGRTPLQMGRHTTICL